MTQDRNKDALDALERTEIYMEDCEIMCVEARDDLRLIERGLRTALEQEPDEARGDDFPTGAIENGRILIDRLENGYEFSQLEDHPLVNCQSWIDLKQCFEYMANYCEQALQPRVDNAEGLEALTRLVRIAEKNTCNGREVDVETLEEIQELEEDLKTMVRCAQKALQSAKPVDLEALKKEMEDVLNDTNDIDITWRDIAKAVVSHLAERGLIKGD